jgi:hypothetical protein
MRSTRSLLNPFLICAPFALLGAAMACGDVPSDNLGGNLVTPKGVLKGTVVYNGPHPCSANGHIIGGAVIFLFDRRNPPPPAGLAATPVNFAVVTGDSLFADEPRNPSSTTYCPQDNGITETITRSAPYTVSPLDGGEYLVQGFYDYTGDFLPTFKFRNLPEEGDVAGGVIDTVDALKPTNLGNPNYLPKFFPVVIGDPQPLPMGVDAGIPNYSIPASGTVVDNVTITLGVVLASRRPYFYAGGLVNDPNNPDAVPTTEAQTSAAPPTSVASLHGIQDKDPNYDPVLVIPQDINVLASPINATIPANVDRFESRLPHLLLHHGLPKAEVPVATASPFKFQIPPAPAPGSMAPPDGFPVWQNALFNATAQKWMPQQIPEGGGMPQLWPLVVLMKLIDDPTGKLDPMSTTSQGSPTAPVVIMQGITLLGGDGTDPMAGDSLFNSGIASAFGTLFDNSTGRPTISIQDHLTVALRPAVICFDSLFDPTNSDKRGTVVTPHLIAPSADSTGSMMQPIVPPTALTQPALASIVNPVPVQGCLPVGRYAINIVYPDAQAWTVPNEAGSCSAAEGPTNFAGLTCATQPRPILYSQGTRAVVEIVPASDPSACAGAMKVPDICLPH